MSKKAVYSNKGLQVYITGEDFEELLEKQTIDVPLFIGKTQSPSAWIVVKTLSGANYDLRRAFTLERGAIDEARQQYKQEQHKQFEIR